jgi:hypothetical protein
MRLKFALKALAIFPIAAVVFVASQWEQNLREQLHELSSQNDELQWMIQKTGEKMNRDAERISALEIKLKAPPAKTN